MVDDTNDETDLIFYRELLDSIHCYVHHLEDVGLRVFTKCHLKQNVCGIEDSNIDLQLELIRRKQRRAAKLLHDNGLQMNIDVDKANKYDLTNQGIKGTLMDKLRDFISMEVGNNDGGHCFCEMLSEEEYDSESVKYDAEDASQSNLSLHSSACYKAMQRYLNLAKLHHYTFSIGYRFHYHYWSQFKTENMRDTLSINDSNDMRSYPIRAKYKSLQDEILNNSISNLTKNELDLSLVKANKYLETRKAKQMPCILDVFGYGFKKGDTIRTDHLTSVILYCDRTELQNQLTISFRKNELYESIASVIKRHREFAIWSRLLREAVEIFGECGGYACKSQHGETTFPGRGPFYCGMSKIVVMPQFDISLFGPTSTSKFVEVATRFGGDDGLVIQLNNNGENGNIWLKSFSCSWLSCHAGEEEWLFCGGKKKIRIENITIMSNRQTFGKFFSALFYFDCMVNGSRMDFDGFNIQSVQNVDTDCAHTIIQNLIDHQLPINRFKNDYPKYINNTFKAYCLHKTKIVVNIHQMKRYFGFLSSLISYMEFDIAGKQTTANDIGFDMDKQTTAHMYRNMKSTLRCIFPNAEKIYIIQSYMELETIP